MLSTEPLATLVAPPTKPPCIDVIDLDEEDDPVPPPASNEETIEASSVAMETEKIETKLIEEKMESAVVVEGETAESRSVLKNMIREISRKELEEIVLKKVIECVNSHTVIGSLRAKCLFLHGMKDRLFQKSGILQKQVSELSKALKLFTENETRPPSAQKPQLPLKFYRSVGLQVNVDLYNKSAVGMRISSQARMTDSNHNALMKQLASNGGGPASAVVTPNNASAMNSPVNGNASNVGLKRIAKPTITVAELRNQVGRVNDQSKVPRLSGPSRYTVQNQQQRVPAAIVPAVNNGKAGENKDGVGSDAGIIVNQNGVQYRVVNRSGGIPPVIVSNASGNFQLVTPQGNRPVVFKATTPGSQPIGRAGQPFTVRAVTNTAIRNAIQQRPILPVTVRGQPNNQTVRLVSPVSNGQPAITKVAETLPLPPVPAPTNSQVQPRLGMKDKPPKPVLTLQEQNGGIVLSWNHNLAPNHAEVDSYQIFACQHPLNPSAAKGQPAPDWKRVGDVKALPLPMACTLSQFSDENRYHFIVRGIDVYNRSGVFCDVVSIVLKKKQQ